MARERNSVGTTPRGQVRSNRSVRWLCLGGVLAAACSVRTGSHDASAPPLPSAQQGTPQPSAAGAAGAGPAQVEAGHAAAIAVPSESVSTPAMTAGAAGEAQAASMQPMAADAGSGEMDAPRVPAPPGCPAPPETASIPEINALNMVNTLRAASGSGCVTLDLNIGKAAAAHCAYYALNKDTAPECTINPHYEVPGCPGFTGTTPTERMRAAGFESGAGSGGEVMAFHNDPTQAVQSWVDSVWHRIPILDPATTVLGYGSAEGCDSVAFGPNRRREALSLVAYPYAGQIGVTTAFDGRYEGPMPPPPATGWPSANPISLYGQQLVVTEHQLFVDGDPTPLDHTWLDPTSPILPEDQQSLLRNVVFMYANQPYLPDTTYRVRIAGTYAGGELLREWTFTTGSPLQRRMR